MNDKFIIKENNKERIIKDLKLTRFACIRCGSRDIEITAVEPYADGIKVHGHNEPSIRDIDIEFTRVTGLLLCGKCKHRFYVKILDQGISNTDVYIDNTLE
jgi:transcription elongation factor Elf1